METFSAGTNGLHLVAGEPKLALVAGASRGLGLLMAKELGALGYQLVICARDAGELDSAHADLSLLGYAVHSRVCDVSDRAAVDELIASVESELGPIEVLVAVAGIIQVGPLQSLEREHFEQAVGTMLWGPVNLALAAAPRMRQRGRGHIATVTSIGGMVSVPHLLPYSTAKFGAVGFSQGLRAELSGTGVKVTTLVPGLMRTGSHLRAQFTGNQPAEYSWFSAGASLPLVSIDARTAARKMVRATVAGKAMCVLTPLAWLAIRVHGLAPGTTANLLGLVGRMLPAAPGEHRSTIEGQAARGRMGPLGRRLSDAITTLGRRAARENNEGGLA